MVNSLNFQNQCSRSVCIAISKPRKSFVIILVSSCDWLGPWHIYYTYILSRFSYVFMMVSYVLVYLILKQ